MLLFSLALAADIREPLSELVAPIVDEGLIGALVVAVIADGEVRYLTFGRMAPDGTRLVNKSTMFEIGSVSKVFTGHLLADAVRRGEVKLLDPASDHLGVALPTWQGGRKITLLDLATHTSGLPRLPPDFEPPDPTDPYAEYSWTELQKSLESVKLEDAPGASYAYSNLGAALLGQALAKATDTPYAQLVEERITVPMRLEVTGIDDSEVVQGHDVDGTAVKPWTLNAFAPAGGIHSNARDLSRFLAAHLNPGSEAAPVIELATRRHRALGEHGAMGLMWHQTASGIRWHNGQTGGYHALVAYKPDADVAVVALGDTATDLVDRIGFAALQLVVGQAAEPIPVRRSKTLDPEWVATLPGNYGPARVTLDGGALWFELPDQPRRKMWAESDRMFFLRGAPVQLTFDGKRLVFEQEGVPTQEWRRRR